MYIYPHVCTYVYIYTYILIYIYILYLYIYICIQLVLIDTLNNSLQMRFTAVFTWMLLMWSDPSSTLVRHVDDSERFSRKRNTCNIFWSTVLETSLCPDCTDAKLHMEYSELSMFGLRSTNWCNFHISIINFLIQILTSTVNYLINFYPAPTKITRFEWVAVGIPDTLSLACHMWPVPVRIRELRTKEKGRGRQIGERTSASQSIPFPWPCWIGSRSGSRSQGNKSWTDPDVGDIFVTWRGALTTPMFLSWPRQKKNCAAILQQNHRAWWSRETAEVGKRFLWPTCSWDMLRLHACARTKSHRINVSKAEWNLQLPKSAEWQLLYIRDTEFVAVIGFFYEASQVGFPNHACCHSLAARAARV